MRRLPVVVGIVVIAGTAAAEPSTDCAREATTLRAHLTAEARSARIWNTAWAIGFGVAAAGQLTLALTSTKPFGEFDTDYRETMYVGAVKATIGMGARVVLPLRVAVPSPQADACADVVALRASVAKAGRIERRTALLTVIGGTFVNLAGSLLLWQRRDFETGALSFAMGLPISPISAYSQPRRSWRLWRESETTWTAGVGGVAGMPRSLWLAGTF